MYVGKAAQSPVEQDLASLTQDRQAALQDAQHATTLLATLLLGLPSMPTLQSQHTAAQVRLLPGSAADLWIGANARMLPGPAHAGCNECQIGLPSSCLGPLP